MRRLDSKKTNLKYLFISYIYISKFLKGDNIETESCNTKPCGCPEKTPCECLTFKNAAGKTYLKYDCSNKELSSLKTVPVWEQAEYVDFSINKLWDPREIYDFFKKLPQLKRIDLDKNYLAELPPQLFAHNHKLQFVNFLNNRLKSIPTLLFRNNAELEVVWFSGNQVCFELILKRIKNSSSTRRIYNKY